MRPIEDRLAAFPRIELTRLPTPLDHFRHLSDLLGTKILVKREDLSDLALGGDKPRKLSFDLAAAIANGADTLVTCGSAQSNHVRLTTAAARRLGLDAVAVISDDEYRAFQGNLLTVYLMGARVVVVDTDDHWDLEETALAECKRIEERGGKPHYIPISGSSRLGSLAGVQMALEIVAQTGDRSSALAAVYAPFGTGGGFTGLLVGLREKGIECPVIGISVNRTVDECHPFFEQHWSTICGLLDVDPSRDRGPYEIHDEFVGEAYGVPTERGLEAISTVARTEGVLIDPVYSGKMFSGLIAHCSRGRWIGQTVVAVHTGGVPALFAYHEALRAHLDVSRPPDGSRETPL